MNKDISVKNISEKDFNILVKKAKGFDILLKNFNVLIEDTNDSNLKIITITDNEFYDRVSEVYNSNDALLLSYIIRYIRKGEK